MERFTEHIETSDVRQDMEELDFDPDEPIGPKPAKDESRLTDLALVCAKVETLDYTLQEIRTLDNGNTVYNEPEETGKKLNSDQGKAVEGVGGTCGETAVENVANMAGKDITEADVIALALDAGLANMDSAAPEDNGGITCLGMVQLLDLVGIEPALLADISPESIADAVESGRGVIACVEVSKFWGYPYEGSHAVTVTSVERDRNGKPVAFYVCDSGTGGEDPARRVDADQMAESLDGNPLVITRDPIR